MSGRATLPSKLRGLLPHMDFSKKELSSFYSPVREAVSLVRGSVANVGLHFLCVDTATASMLEILGSDSNGREEGTDSSKCIAALKLCPYALQ
jgi:hypothetical protein